MPEGGTCLLIGNSRWHWATRTASGWRFDHTNPEPARLDGIDLTRWAAVGAVPDHGALTGSNQLDLTHVPLQGMPPWLGVDRALAGWAAWRAAAPVPSGSGVIVADAGTVLSLTLVTADGGFAGGQLAAGLRLQLTAMAAGTRDLPPTDGLDPWPDHVFPQDTLAAMQQGCFHALLGVLLEAQRHCDWPLWICGGDAPLLVNALEQRGSAAVHAPDLVMQGMVGLLS